MTLRTRRTALLALLAAGLPGVSVAQVAGLPVRNAGIGTGTGLAADVGFPSGDAGKGVAFGATGVIGLGPLGLSASLAHWKPKGLPAVNSAGGSANLKVFGGPLIPLSVTLQAGLARWRQSASSIEGDGFAIRTWHLPLGLGVALTIPNPAFGIKPWIAPRLDVQRTTQSDGGTASEVSNTDSNFGISGGVDLSFLNGLSIRLMYDRVLASDGIDPSVLSLGLGVRVGK